MPKAFEIGKLRNRVSWQAAVPAPRQAGRQQDVDYLDKGWLWVSLEPLRGAELFQAAQLKASTFFKIICRFGPIQVGDRLVLQGVTPRTFTIDSAYRENETNEYLVMTATELK